MQFIIRGVRFYLSFWFFAIIACLLLSTKGTIAFYFMLPIAVHEAGHMLIMALLGVAIDEISFTPLGIRIKRKRGKTLSSSKEIVVSLGGALANALFALWLYFFCFQSMRVMFLISANIAVLLFCLAPIKGLDGGDVLQIITERFFYPDTARTISKGFSVLVLALLFGFAFFLILIRYANPTLLISCVYLAANVIFRDR